MTALLRVYDKITAPTCVILGLTAAATAFSLYDAYGYDPYPNPTVSLVSLCAGSALAILADVYIAHNSEFKSKAERNNVYAAFAIIVGFTHLKDTFIFGGITYNVYRLFDYFGYYQIIQNFTSPVSVGFLATTLVLQLMDYRQPVVPLEIENKS